MIGRNNPLNIRYNPLNSWRGSSGKTRGFVNFRELKYGLRAAAYLLMVSYGRQGLYTVSEKIHRFAPPIENLTSKYVSYVCDHTDLLPFDNIESLTDLSKVLYYMWCYEQGKKPSLSSHEIGFVLSEFKEILNCFSDGSK